MVPAAVPTPLALLPELGTVVPKPTSISVLPLDAVALVSDSVTAEPVATVWKVRRPDVSSEARTRLAPMALAVIWLLIAERNSSVVTLARFLAADCRAVLLMTIEADVDAPSATARVNDTSLVPLKSAVPAVPTAAPGRKPAVPVSEVVAVNWALVAAVVTLVELVS